MPKENRRVKARLSVDLDSKTKEHFEALVKREKLDTLTQLIRKSVVLFDLVTEHQREGGAVVFRRKDGTEERLLLL